jgi:hypothetical protein
MSQDFDAAFDGILKKKQRDEREQQRDAARDRIELGSTESGRTIAQGATFKRESESGSAGFRELPVHRGHASKAHHGRKTVRKNGVSWR